MVDEDLGLFFLLVLVDPLNIEDLVLMDLLVDGELASLPETLVASRMGTLEWFLASVGVSMFFQVLG